jgi:hypothetical protein
MIMKTVLPSPKFSRAGGALMLTMIMTGVALAMLAAAMTWSSNTTRLTHRSIQHTRAIAAAEAATEKVVSHITQDYLSGGEKMVRDNQALYRSTVPTAADSAFWGRWAFYDSTGNAGTDVQRGLASNYVVLNSTYAGLRGYATTYTVVSQARENAGMQEVTASVLQEVQLARIPIFQFAMYSSGYMEIGCGQPFNITGRVHANETLYVQPVSDLTFESDVTAVGDILFERHPLDRRTPPYGTVVYHGRKESHVAAMTLPIGTTNTPTAIREIIHPPPSGENPNSALGQLRYYNQAEMILTVSNSGITATSGRFNNFATPVPSNEVAAIVTTANSFTDKREGKTVRPVDINIRALTAWSATNSNLRSALGTKDVSSVYVVDRRTLGGTELAAVRVYNGEELPPRGLTVATARPLYVKGHYNAPNLLHRGTANTSATEPASLVGDAITILSPAWLDANGALSLNLRIPLPTTVNAALLTGVVETTLDQYSGGMENFPRFLEKWSGLLPFTYNGSMVKMFPSFYATNVYGKSDVYSVPKRDWAYDTNFNDPAKLPPLTPSLQKVIRGQWATVAPRQDAAMAVP